MLAEKLAKQDHRSGGYTPKDRSLANTVRAIYDCLDELREFVEPEADLFHELAEAVTDNYQRNRSQKARFRPKQSEKKKKKIKPPEVRPMERDEKEKLKALLLRYYQEYKNQNLKVHAVGLQQYSRKNLTQQLANLVLQPS